MLAIVVDIDLHPGRRDDFLTLIRANAAGATQDEPGCRRFDVCLDPDRPESVLLYEVYDDGAAFEAHRASPHFITYDAASPPLIREKRVRRLQIDDAR